MEGSRSNTGEDRVMQCRILLKKDLQNRVYEIIVIQQGHDESMKRLQRAEVDRDFEFGTTGCYAQRIQQIEQWHLKIYIFSNQFVCKKRRVNHHY
jgi:hypothetical protein